MGKRYVNQGRQQLVMLSCAVAVYRQLDNPQLLSYTGVTLGRPSVVQLH